MNKNDKLDAAIFEDEARWQEIEQDMSKTYPRVAVKLNALFVSRRQSLQKSQKHEAEGRRFFAFMLLMKTWSLQTKINKLLKKIADKDC